MTDSDSQPSERFTRRPRAAPETKRVALENFLDSVEAISAFLDQATSGGRDGFRRNSPAYACGSLAIIRAAALFETDAFSEFVADTPDEVAKALRTMRNIASHSGYRAMNDDRLWVTLTVELPPHVARWRTAAQTSSSS